MAIEDNRQPQGPRVLDGVKVLDFSAFISGPYCTRMLADLGADVLKVEPPGGEAIRHAPPTRGEASMLFSHLNAGKRCITLDLKMPAAQTVVKKLVETYDVVVENFSPGVMKRLGLDYETLRAVNPKIIMCSISGFGQTGPDSNRAAFAPVVQAWSGYDAVNLDAQPTLDKPLNMGPPVADTTASLQAFGAITAALFYRERNGIGQYIDIAMYDALISTLHKDFQQMQKPLDNDRYYGPLKTQDGWIILMVLTAKHFTALCEIIEHPELQSDSKFSTLSSRLHNYSEFIGIVEAWTAQHHTAEIETLLASAKLPMSQYRELSASLDDPQLVHRNMITEVVDSGGPLKVTNAPFLFSETHAAIGERVAEIGEHNVSVFADELGLSRNEAAALQTAQSH